MHSVMRIEFDALTAYCACRKLRAGGKVFEHEKVKAQKFNRVRPAAKGYMIQCAGITDGW